MMFFLMYLCLCPLTNLPLNLLTHLYLYLLLGRRTLVLFEFMIFPARASPVTYGDPLRCLSFSYSSVFYILPGQPLHFLNGRCLHNSFSLFSLK